MGESAPFIKTLSARISRRAEELASMIARQEVPEAELIGKLFDYADMFQNSLFEKFEQLPPRRSRNSRALLFDDLYAVVLPSNGPAGADDSADTDERPSGALLTALLAAESEYHGPIRLNEQQSLHLAEVYEGLGMQLTGLPRHAAVAFQRAKALYRTIEDRDAEDRCGLRLAKTRTRTAQGWRYWVGRLADVSCGYGYQPFRLLFWVLFALVGFTVVAFVLAGVGLNTLYLSLTGFLNPVGSEGLPDPAKPLFAVEAWAGSVLMSVFFALLVRKWFRL